MKKVYLLTDNFGGSMIFSSKTKVLKHLESMNGFYTLDGDIICKDHLDSAFKRTNYAEIKEVSGSYRGTVIQKTLI